MRAETVRGRRVGSRFTRGPQSVLRTDDVSEVITDIMNCMNFVC